MFRQFFFLTGLGAVAFFFAGVVLLGMSLFAETEPGRRRLTRAQSVALLLLLALTAWTALRLQENLIFRFGSEPNTTASALLEAERETMTGMLLGLSLVVNALLAAFAWVRIAQPGNALRALVWAFPGLQLVLGCKNVLEALQAPGMPDLALVQSGAFGKIWFAAAVAGGVVLLSWPASWLLRRFALRSGSSAP